MSFISVSERTTILRARTGMVWFSACYRPRCSLTTVWKGNPLWPRGGLEILSRRGDSQAVPIELHILQLT